MAVAVTVEQCESEPYLGCPGHKQILANYDSALNVSQLENNWPTNWLEPKAN